jgi:uncharacterized protein (TIGR02246 family)
MQIFVVLALAAALLSCSSTHRRTSDTTNAIRLATQAWAEAFNSRQPSRITALYAEDAALWGTTSKTLAKSPAELAAYFQGVATAPKNRVELGEQHIRRSGNFAINSGYYTFHNVSADGKAFSVPARFTFVFRNDGGKWAIVDHHSSRIPAIGQ